MAEIAALVLIGTFVGLALLMRTKNRSRDQPIQPLFEFVGAYRNQHRLSGRAEPRHDEDGFASSR
ncbi:hypothetical protein [Nocardia sp. CA-119907]|uniref:hypothetical protein n=1 Tax=Nocardia sp. CA-119907 TaxID=3239973 RepID=UPI003D95C36F